jgi:hypothetical protein
VAVPDSDDSDERHPRTAPTASTIVSASANSTVEAMKEASADAAELQSIVCLQAPAGC